MWPDVSIKLLKFIDCELWLLQNRESVAEVVGMMWLGCCKIEMVTLPAADFAHFSSICRHSKDISSYIEFAPADHDDGDCDGNHDVGSNFESQISGSVNSSICFYVSE